MKKLLILTLMICSIFIAAASNTVKAIDPETWDDYWHTSIVETDDCSPSPDCNAAIYSYTAIPAGAKEFTIILPSSYYHAINATGTSSVNASIAFRDSSGNLIDTVMWEDQFGASVSGSYRLDLVALDVADAVTVYVTMPQTFRYNAIPGGYLTYIQTNMTYSYEYSVSTDVYMIGDLTASYHRFTTRMDMDYNTKSFRVATHNIDYLLIYDTIYNSRVSFYDESDVFLYSENLKDHILNDEDVIDIPIDFDVVDLNEIAYFDIVLYFEPDLVTYSLIEATNENLTITFNERELITVKYYVSGVLDNTDTQLLGFIYPTHTPAAIEGYDFAYWILPDGQIVYSYTGIAEEHVKEGGYVNLYAVFYFEGGAGGTSGENPESDPTRGINKILAAVGFDTPLGHMLFFLATILSLTYILIAKLKAPAFVAIITAALIMILFTYWGLLPTYVTISVSIFLIVGALMTITRKGGAESE